MKQIPSHVKKIITTLQDARFDAYIVGGCVRDLLLNKEPKDWDVTTSAKPKEVQKLFKDSFYENEFFTVTVLTKSKKESEKQVEVTTFRSDITYKDMRHPEEFRYAKTLDEDLSRRDFTMNAIALDSKGNIQDPFNGKKDIEKKLVKAVGDPKERFSEDALRMMRAVRLASQLEFSIEEETKVAIQDVASLLKKISQERIRDEFIKIIMTKDAMEGVELLRDTGLLRYIVPELEEGYGIEQNKHHIYTVWEHNLLALQYAVKNNWSLEVRIASLFHDIGKPRVKEGKGENSTFYAHEVVGGKMTRDILIRLKFSGNQVKKISKLVRYHLFYYNVDEVSESSVRRLVRKVGAQDMEDLLQLRMADRIGSGVPKAEPYKLRHLRYIIERAGKAPITSSMLKTDGSNIMNQLQLEPGPQVGSILSILLEEVVEDPKLNTKKYLVERTGELGKLKKQELEKLAEKAKVRIEQVENKEDSMIKQKYWVS
ncbi:MAG: HD domain-containing protein [Patescibacteria group bacterium]|nr:HD domain-containing protein [Patescibacteria group bacterium]